MIDTKRLATDAAYWDECGAPEDATHYSPGRQKFIIEGAKGAYLMEELMHHHIPERIPRPQSEWVDGLPPVGVECEVQVQEGEPWYVVEIIAHYDGSAVFVAGDDYPYGVYDGCSHPENFRPTPTKAQRDRDELVEIIGQLHIEFHGNESGGEFNVDVGPVADAIIAAGWRKDQ